MVKKYLQKDFHMHSHKQVGSNEIDLKSKIQCSDWGENLNTHTSSVVK